VASFQVIEFAIVDLPNENRPGYQKPFTLSGRSTKKNIFELCKYLKSMKKKSLLISLFLCTMITGTFIKLRRE